jgi:hypothetical protein
MSAENKNCLINETACGRIEGNPVCPKCGMDERVVYPGQADLEEAQAAALVRYRESLRKTDLQEAVDYEAARGDLERLIEFIDKWPNGSFAVLASDEIIELRADLKAAEEEEKKWEVAAKGDSISSYMAYLEAYPDGRFSKQAKAKIDSERKQSLLYFVLLFANFPPFLLFIFGARGIWAGLLMSLLSSVAAGWVAHEKGRRWWVWSPIGFIFTFPGFVIVMLLPSKKANIHCEGWKMGRVVNLVGRSLCLMAWPLFSLLSHSWLGMISPGVIFGYLWFNVFTKGMGRLVFGELAVPSGGAARVD